MELLTLKDIRPLPEYEPIRDSFRERIISIKKRRRIFLGDRISIIFENRETIQWQIQEMMRVEHIYDPAKIQSELDVYNRLIAGPDELSATLFIEITQQDQVKEILDRLQGIDNNRSIYIELGAEKIYALFETGHSKEDKLSAVHYIRFQITQAQKFALGDDSVPASLVLDHPNLRAKTALHPDTRHELANDFR